MPEVNWYHNGKVVVPNPDFKTHYDRQSGECVLHILEVFPQDQGRYECIAANKYGRAITKAFLQVEGRFNSVCVCSIHVRGHVHVC